MEEGFVIVNSEQHKKRHKSSYNKAKVLPPNFFENMLNLEIILSQEFSIINLQNVLDFYSTAIEYYESIDDRRFKDYQIRLSNLLSQPEIVRKMSDSSHVDNKSIEKQKLKLQVDFKNQSNTFTQNDKSVQNIVKNIKDLNNNQEYKSILDNNLQSQNENLRLRLENRKNKKIKDEINNSDKLNEDKEVVDDYTLIKAKTTKILKLNIDEINEDQVKETSIFNLINDENIDIEKNKQVYNKYKEVIEASNSSLLQFISETNLYFYKYAFQRFVDRINVLYEQRFKKYTEICRIYQNQIKEMEFLQNEDDQHSESISMIINSLKEEKQHELERMEMHYDSLIQENLVEFKNYGLINNSGLQLLEEKFKLEIFNNMNSYLVPDFIKGINN